MLLAPCSSRLGISLTEVLISMGILTLGLLGVAAIFPVGSFYMLKADIADNGSAIAQSVMNDIVARGMLNPWAWYVVTPNPMSTVPTAPNYRFMTIDGKYTPTRAPIASTFTRPFGEALSEGLRNNTDPVVLAKQFGSAYVIDPMFAAAATTNTTTNFNVVGYAFPASAFSLLPWATAGSGTYYIAQQWDPWRPFNRNSDRTWPIRRVTFQQPTGWPLDARTAEHLFRGSDDLTTDFPPRDDRPAAQNWELVDLPPSGRIPLARGSTGDYSWIVTIVPTTSAARDGLARNPESFAYDVSVVVFYKRVLPSAPAITGTELTEAVSGERTVGASIVSTGLNGGEVLLTDLGDSQASPFEQLKTGQWMMLCGPHPASSTSEPRFLLNWYQVLAIDKESAGIDPVKQRIVALRGPQWPWQPANYPGYPNGELSNDVCAGICRGAVAVHTKTLRFESPRAAVMNLVTPRGATPPIYVPF